MEKKIAEKVLEYIVAIPQLLFAAVFSFLSGHLWIWVIYAYYNKSSRAVKHLNNWAAKVALGAFWYTITLLPIYFYKFGVNSEVDSNIIRIIVFSILIGSFIQAFVTILIVRFAKP